MLIGLALVGAAILGTAIHFLVPDRSLRGRTVSAFVATAASGVIYTALTWLGLGESNALLWLASIPGAALIALIATVVITSARRRHDAAELQRIGVA